MTNYHRSAMARVKLIMGGEAIDSEMVLEKQGQMIDALRALRSELNNMGPL